MLLHVPDSIIFASKISATLVVFACFMFASLWFTTKAVATVSHKLKT